MGPGNLGAVDLTRVNSVEEIPRLRAQLILNTSTNELSGRLIGHNPVGTAKVQLLNALTTFNG
jgi:hypothetical protein